MVAIALIAGCVGTNLKRRAGRYDGYEVVVACEGRGTTGDHFMSINGLGTVVPPKELLPAFAWLLQEAVDGNGHRVGSVCGHDLGIEILLRDWRELDHTIQEIGQWLSFSQLALRVQITVVGEIVAL